MSARVRTIPLLLATAIVAGGLCAVPPAALAASYRDPAVTKVSTPSYAGQLRPFRGQWATIEGNIGTDGSRPVTLQKYADGRWSAAATGNSTANGSYSFGQAATLSATQAFRVVAPASGGNSAVTSKQVALITQTDTVRLSLRRAQTTVQITGTPSPVIPGRSFTLQAKAGKSWRAVRTLSARADGRIAGSTPIHGQQTYRLVAARLTATPTSVQAVSNSVGFKPNPARVGRNVMYVTTVGGKMPTTKGKEYRGTAVLVVGNSVVGSYPLEAIAVRGHSTAVKPKKPYKVKFASKQAPFGMTEGKTWALLANYVDRSLVRNKVAFDLARKQSGLGWTPDSRFTELYLNGKYLGSYQLTQTIKIGSDRADLKKKYGQIIEFDPFYRRDGVPGFHGQSGMPFSFKDPDEWKKLSADDPDAIHDPARGWLDPEGLTTAKVTAVTKKIRTFEAVLYGKNGKRDWSKINPAKLQHCDWSRVDLGKATLSAAEWKALANCDWTDFLDMTAAVDYILVREFAKDIDSDFYRSNFFSINDYRSDAEKITMGPVWDFDRSAGDQRATNRISKTSGWWTDGHGAVGHNTNKIHWFTRIWKDPRFKVAVKARWGAKRADYSAVSARGVNLAVAQLANPTAASGATNSLVAANDRARWGTRGPRYPRKAATYAGEVRFLKKWYAGRYAWMNSAIRKL